MLPFKPYHAQPKWMLNEHEVARLFNMDEYDVIHMLSSEDIHPCGMLETSVGGGIYLYRRKEIEELYLTR